MEKEQYTNGHTKPNQETLSGERSTVPSATAINEGGSDAEASKEVENMELCTNNTLNGAKKETSEAYNTLRNDTQKDTEKSLETQTRDQKLDWANIVKINRPQQYIPRLIREKILKTKNILDQANLLVTYKPKPGAVYFKIVRRGPICATRTALRQSLPSCAVLGLSFVGGSMLEIIPDGRLKDRLITTLEALSLQEVPKFDVYAATAKAREEHTSTEKGDMNNVHMVVKRMNECINTSRKVFARKWYETTKNKAEEVLESMANAAKRGMSQGKMQLPIEGNQTKAPKSTGG